MKSFSTLLAEIRPRLPSSSDRRGLHISPSLHLLVTLRYLATGTFQLKAADTADMLQASASRSIKRVVHAIAEVSAGHIKFPTPPEGGTVMQAFTIADCINGTLILSEDLVEMIWPQGFLRLQCDGCATRESFCRE
ncbi:uncharacterized protein LOC135102752 [Scylla paramamosain]|uniref:uncharacterized protein LOC135102752 n=1 Tax=Scylla paramamosain TaxID=85552 RepID=UPI003082F204